MLKTVIITVFGPDRPGLVEEVSACVVGCGGNWLESRMLHLGGHFAGIARLEVEDVKHDKMVEALRALDREGLNVVVHVGGTGDSISTMGRSAEVEIVGHDRPGIVREISHAFAARRVNVEELSTERTSAPMTGEPIFKARAQVVIPPGVDSGDLRRDLEKIASDLMIDLSFSPKN